MHLREVEEPCVNDIPDGRGVLVRVLLVGVDGTDNDLVKATAFYPGWLEKLLTTRVPGVASYQQLLRELSGNNDAIKVFVEVGRP
jgi:hypothetical protein